MKQIIKDGQSLADVAVQEFGSWEAMIAIARQNGISMTEIPAVGTELTMPDRVWNRTMQLYCRNNDVVPATANDQSGVRLKIFTSEFTEQFK
ncbi:MAG: LysM domain-containing protein [Prevotella sp.]|nr:LysM domain-containing protein [Prevotella sp.]